MAKEQTTLRWTVQLWTNCASFILQVSCARKTYSAKGDEHEAQPHLLPLPYVSWRSRASRSDTLLPALCDAGKGDVGVFSWSAVVERDASDTLYVPSVVIVVVGEVLQQQMVHDICQRHGQGSESNKSQCLL